MRSSDITPPRSTENKKRRRAEAMRASAPHVLSEELFKASLIRQRQRIERSNQPVVLLLVAFQQGSRAEVAPSWGPTIEALAAAMRETDVLGWFERQSVLGVILPDFDAIDASRRHELENRLRHMLATRLSADTLDRLSIRFHVHFTPDHEGADGVRPADPLLEPVRKRRKGHAAYAAVKRALDIIVSSILLALFAPLFLIIAVAVKLTSEGPVFYRQERVGQRMKRFTILKFRTMSVKADHTIHHEFVSQFIQAGASQGKSADNFFKIANDPRVTAVGRVLRKTSLDELPQLWNVLRGDMSLVGPRPPIPYEVAQYKMWHCRRVLEAKPGITGLWQVTGRSRTTFDEMVRLDIRYAKTCSLSTDVKILLATPGAVFEGKGAC
jgi:lipopolysaccharide/colanic/teichoic acid biosynthesis glycosyltransferase